MSSPTGAYEAARAAYARTVIEHGAIGHRAGHHDAILAAVDAVFPIVEAATRAKVAAEIRAGIASSVAKTELSMIGEDGVAGGNWYAASDVQKLIERIAEGSTDG